MTLKKRVNSLGSKILRMIFTCNGYFQHTIYNSDITFMHDKRKNMNENTVVVISHIYNERVLVDANEAIFQLPTCISWQEQVIFH